MTCFCYYICETFFFLYYWWFFFVWIPLCLLNPLLTPAIYAARQGERSLLALLGRAAIWVVEVCSPIPWQVITLGILALVTAVSLLLLRKCPATL